MNLEGGNKTKPNNLKIVSIIVIFIGILGIITPVVFYFSNPPLIKNADDQTYIVAGLVWGVIFICAGIIDYFRAEKELQENINAIKKSRERYCPNCGRAIPFDAIICPYCKKEFEENKQIDENQLTQKFVKTIKKEKLAKELQEQIEENLSK